MESKREGLVIDQEEDDWSPPLFFAHLRDGESVKSIQETCRLLGCYGDTSVVVDTLVHAVTGSEANRSEYLLLFHWIMKGVEPHNSLNLVINGLVEIWEELREKCISDPTPSSLVYETCLLNMLLGDVAMIQGESCDNHVTSIHAFTCNVMESLAYEKLLFMSNF